MTVKTSRKHFNRLSLSILLILVLSCAGTAFAVQDGSLSGNASSEEMDGNFGRPAARAAAKPELIERTRLAAELRGKWRLDEAESIWREILTHDDKNREALIGLAEIERTRLNYPQALQYLNRAAALDGESGVSPQLLVAYGSFYLTLEEPDKAAQYFAQAREAAPTYPGAILGEAGVALLKRDYSRAERLLSELLRSDPNRVEAHIGLARVYLEENRNTMAAQEAQRALELDRYNVEAMAALCAVRVAEKKPDAVRKLAKSVLELNPYNNGVRRLLSQYLNSKKAFQVTLKADAQTAIARGDKLKDAGRLREAITEYRQAINSEPKAMRALLGLGACEMALNNYSTAAQVAERALLIDPDNALAHLQLALAQSGLHEQGRIQVGATDWRSRYLVQHQKSFDGLGDIFINFNRLSRSEQQVIEQAVAPLAGFIKELRRKGAKHYLLAIDRKLSDVFGYESLENRMTFDGRYYASVRGVGGLVTVSGVEYLDVAMRGGFNTIAHEFAHQVHTSALPTDITDRIKRLYQRALKDGRVLDYYAASNEWEYFAQGYEAYVSDFKRPNAGVTARHTKDELLQQDPDLYNLFEELSGKARPSSLLANPSTNTR